MATITTPQPSILPVAPSMRWAGAVTGTAIFVLCLITLRSNPGAFVAAPFVRALAIRGAFTALVCSAAVFLTGVAVRRFSFWKCAVAFCCGFTFNAAVTCVLSLRFDPALLAAARRVERQGGAITIVTHEGDEFPVRPTGPGEWVRTGAVADITPLAARMLCAAEDERCLSRQLPADPMALLRAGGVAVYRAVSRQRGALPGASDLAEQTGGLLLALKPQGRGLEAWRTKIEKTLAGVRVHDLYSTEEQVRLYLSLAPFGSLKGHEAIGLEAAARVFYGRGHRELSAAQLAELMARLRNPNLYFPFQHPGEPPAAFEARLDTHRRRTGAIIDVARRKGWLTDEEADTARGEFLKGLPDRDTAAANLLVPRASSLIARAQQLAGPAFQGHLVVETAASTRVQIALEAAIADGTQSFASRLPWGRHRGDRIAVDAVAIAPTGGIVAMCGLAAIPGGMASQLKPELYALARARGIQLPWQALSRSLNPQAIQLAHRVGLDVYVDHLRSQGYQVIGAWEPVVLGAGVTGSPRLVAGNFAKFGYGAPGVRLAPDLIERLWNAETGETLFELPRTQVFPVPIAIEVRKALEMTSTAGTARDALRALAETAPVAAKTGTAGFYRRGAWQGEGGSWCVAADSATRLTIAVRVRWQSGRPFELEGGRSAACIMRHAIEALRALDKENER